ncbi:MAG TPA: ribosome recycling factor [Candidatus Sumerlaeota bacterium]|nr:ribosome recycling factor [Candidatus Sumerlaeota bacterium]
MLKEIFRKTEGEMKQCLTNLEHEFSTIRTGRANPALLESVVVEAYGSKAPLKQIASISIPDARTIMIQPWDKNQLQAIEKAILAANLGFTPGNDGRVIRITIPALTEDRRKEYVKMAKHMAEESRVAVRNVRRKHKDEVKVLEKDHKISEDEMHTDIERIQEMTDKHIKIVDDLLVKKEQEIMEV